MLKPNDVLNRLLAHVGCPVRLGSASDLQKALADIHRWIDSQIEDARVADSTTTLTVDSAASGGAGAQTFKADAAL